MAIPCCLRSLYLTRTCPLEKKYEAIDDDTRIDVCDECSKEEVYISSVRGDTIEEMIDYELNKEVNDAKIPETDKPDQK